MPGNELDGANRHVSRHFVRDLDHHEPLQVVARQKERLVHPDHEVRFTQNGAFGKLGPRRKIPGISLGGAVLRPDPNPLDLGITEIALSQKVTIGGIGRPRRHDASRGHLGNGQSVSSDIRICQQRERPDRAGPVAGRAVLEYDGRDVRSEGWDVLGDAGLNPRAFVVDSEGWDVLGGAGLNPRALVVDSEGWDVLGDAVLNPWALVVGSAFTSRRIGWTFL